MREKHVNSRRRRGARRTEGMEGIGRIRGGERKDLVNIIFTVIAR